MSDIAHFSRTYASIEEIVPDSRFAGLSLEYCQLDRQQKPCSMQVIASPSVVVTRFTVSNRLHHLISSESGRAIYGVLAGMQRPSRVAGREFGAAAILQADSDRGLDAVVEPGFDGYVLVFDENHLAELADRHRVSYESGPGTERLVCPQGLRNLRKLLSELQYGADTALSGSRLSDLLQTELPLFLLSAWSKQQPVPETCAGTRRRAAVRAAEYIRAQPREAISVKQLCDACAVSYSTLERAFREEFGVTPREYILNVRLCGVRKRLLAKDNAYSVTDVSHEWGFRHMGKFAGAYRRLFGELPSETRA